MIIKNQQERELLRRALIDYLAPRFRGAFSCADLARILPRRGLVDFAVDADDVGMALKVMQDKGWIAMVKETTDSVLEHAQITGEGIQEYERRSGTSIGD